MFRSPTVAPASSDLDAASRQLAAQSNAFVAVTTPTLIPVVVVLAVYLRGATPTHRLLLWCLPIVVLSIVVPITALMAWRRRAQGSVRHFERLIAGGIMIAGTMIGLSELILVVPDTAPRQAMVIQLFITGIASSAVLTFGPSTRNFVAFQVPANGLNALAILLGANQVPKFLWPIALMFLVMLSGAHYFTANAMKTALIGRARGERLLKELERQAAHDPLTGVANRFRFLEDLTTALALARRRGELVAVLFIDLDHFKAVNDTYGHATGDAVLVEMAKRLREEVRTADVVARQGGDEFTVLLVSPKSTADALDVAERMCRRMNEPFVVGNERLDLTASLGLAVNDDLESDPDVLLRNADLALYRAKALGRNRAEVLDASLRQTLANRRSEENELRAAFEAGQLEAWFQPVIDMPTGITVGAEALVRWVHPSRGVLGPGSFLPLIREFGLERQLTETMISQTLTALARAVDEGLVSSNFRISVNIESQRTMLTGTIHSLSEAADAGLPVSQLVLELTENAVFSESSAIEALERARSMGVSVALDDFGTGESPLSLVRDLPLDFIKIDRRFVLGMLTHQADLAIVAAVLEMGKMLDVFVVAEGVESTEHEQRLVDLGCRLAQGFLYSKAVPADEFIERLRENRPAALRVWGGSHG